jgi:hypothetical protein
MTQADSRISDNAGALLLREVDHRLGLTAAPDAESQEIRVGHTKPVATGAVDDAAAMEMLLTAGDEDELARQLADWNIPIRQDTTEARDLPEMFCGKREFLPRSDARPGGVPQRGGTAPSRRPQNNRCELRGSFC